MYEIQQIIAQPLQQHTFIIQPDGTAVTMTFYFRSMQQGWFIQSLTYQISDTRLFAVNNLRVTNNPNLLRQWKNLIPFGLACFSTADREPSLLEDFTSQSTVVLANSLGAAPSILYLLSAAEVQEYEDFLMGDIVA